MLQGRYNQVSFKRKLPGFIVGSNDKQSRFRQLIGGVSLQQVCIYTKTLHIKKLHFFSNNVFDVTKQKKKKETHESYSVIRY